MLTEEKDRRRMMDISMLEEMMKDGGRAVLLLRHAERPPLDPGDTTFGIDLPITGHGRETAKRYGKMLSRIVGPESLRAYASETLRTRQTADCIWEGFLGSGADSNGMVTLLPELGGESPFFGSLDERMALIAEGRYLERLNEYFRNGVQLGYKPLEEATAKMEECLCHLLDDGVQLVVAVTHDINVASFLAGRGIEKEFDKQSWPHYLDAVVVARTANGEMRYGFLRYEPSSDGGCI